MVTSHAMPCHAMPCPDFFWFFETRIQISLLNRCRYFFIYTAESLVTHLLLTYTSPNTHFHTTY